MDISRSIEPERESDRQPNDICNHHSAKQNLSIPIDICKDPNVPCQKLINSMNAFNFH